MSNIISAFLWFVLIGGALGTILVVAGKYLYVASDERAEKIRELLPGGNCGGCGYGSCNAFAEAVAAGQAKPGGCNLGNQQTADAISALVGIEAEPFIKRRAHVMCLGSGTYAAKKYSYAGAFRDCSIASKQGGGSQVCPTGCTGGGSCVRACPFDAISMKNGVAVINVKKCTGCGSCVKVCPKKIIVMVPETSGYLVSCMSADSAKNKNRYCDIGCIGCKRCVRECESNAIVMTGSLAAIDYAKCVNCGKCMEVCPRHTITSAGLKKPSQEQHQKGA